jgi:hypothetical protein
MVTNGKSVISPLEYSTPIAYTYRDKVCYEHRRKKTML